MGGLIKLIKNLFSGILSLLSGLIGSKKSMDSAPKTRRSPGYFLELHEDEIPKPITVSKPTAEASHTPTVTTAVSDTAPTPNKKSSEPVLLAVATNDSNGSGSSTSVAEKAPAPVAAAVAPKPEASVEFATKYLVPTSSGNRRRPGANMNSYLDMARDMKSN